MNMTDNYPLCPTMDDVLTLTSSFSLAFWPNVAPSVTIDVLNFPNLIPLIGRRGMTYNKSNKWAL